MKKIKTLFTCNCQWKSGKSANYSALQATLPHQRKEGERTAFTLAEVLITLGIIGIVAAMTMPTIIQNKKETETISKLKKVYSTLSQAFLHTVSENGTPDDWGMTGMYDVSSHYIMGKKFEPYLKIATNCIGMDTNKTIKACNPHLPQPTNAVTVILLDGTTTSFRVWDGNCTLDMGNSPALKKTCGEITVDLNGKKLPNKPGNDRFTFYFTKLAIVPLGVPESKVSFERNCDINNKNIHEGFSPMVACTAWLLYSGNMDYLKCDDLRWNGKTKCGD